MFSILNSEPARGQIRPLVWKFFFSFLRRPATGMTNRALWARSMAGLRFLSRSNSGLRPIDSRPGFVIVVEQFGLFRRSNGSWGQSNASLLEE